MIRPGQKGHPESTLTGRLVDLSYIGQVLHPIVLILLFWVWIFDWKNGQVAGFGSQGTFHLIVSPF